MLSSLITQTVEFPAGLMFYEFNPTNKLTVIQTLTKIPTQILIQTPTQIPTQILIQTPTQIPIQIPIMMIQVIQIQQLMK